MICCEWRGTLKDTLAVLTGVTVCFIMGFVADNTIVLVVQHIANAIRNAICNRNKK